MEVINSKFRDLLVLKAPGISASRIKGIQEAAVENVGEHEKVVNTLVAFSAKAPVSHKLGILYVVDAVARGFQDEIKKGNSQYKSALEDLSSHLSGILSNLKVRHQYPDIFEKMLKVLQIWQKADTFNHDLLASEEKKYFYRPFTHTPPSSPGPNYIWGGLDEDVRNKPKAPPKPIVREESKPVDASSILATLAKFAKTEDTGAQAAPASAAQAPSEQPKSLLEQVMAGSTSADPAPLSPPRGRSNRSSSNSTRDRSRSPDSHPGASRFDQGHPASTAAQSKHFTEDPSLIPLNAIRVLSRTLFVGSIPMYMDDKIVRKLIEEVVPVQSLIFNRVKSHAFVKVFTRDDASRLRDTWEQKGRSSGFELRARWGVGYGPRDCFDYHKGVSIIPIERLTEIDMKWALTAPNGGTHGIPIKAGMVFEEPDIEVGAGNSSRNQARPRAQPQPQPTQLPMGFPMMPQPGTNFGDSQMPMNFPMMFPGMMGQGMPFPMMMPPQDMSKMFTNVQNGPQPQPNHTDENSKP